MTVFKNLAFYTKTVFCIHLKEKVCCITVIFLGKYFVTAFKVD